MLAIHQLLLIIHLKCVSDGLFSTGGAPKSRRALGNLPLYILSLDGPWCVNNALKN